MLIELYRDQQLIAAKKSLLYHEHSKLMIKELDSILTNTNTSLIMVDRIIVTEGPGSYTGTRLALTIAKTVGTLNKNLEIMTISSFALYGYSLTECVAVLMDARGGRSYFAIYDQGQKLYKETIIYLEDLKDYLSSLGKKVILTGQLDYLEGNSFFTSLPTKAINDSFLPFVSDFSRNITDPRTIKPPYTYPLFYRMEHLITREDATKLDQLEAQSFSEKPSYPFYTENLESKYVQVLLLKINHQIIGFLSYLITFDSSTIIRLFIDKNFRRQGLATKLLEAMLEDLFENDVLTTTLEVRVSNQVAIDLYQKFSYQGLTIKKQYYSDGEDALYMMRAVTL